MIVDYIIGHNCEKYEALRKSAPSLSGTAVSWLDCHLVPPARANYRLGSWMF
jgi:hypothetical protein